LPPTRPTFFDVSGSRDTQDHGTKDDGADEHFDQANECVSEHFAFDRILRIKVAKSPASQNGHQNPEVQVMGEFFHVFFLLITTQLFTEAKSDKAICHVNTQQVL
jgi:hypothetical protein